MLNSRSAARACALMNGAQAANGSSLLLVLSYACQVIARILRDDCESPTRGLN